MSKIALSPNASGTGTLSIVAPNTNTDRTLTLPDNSGTVITTASTGVVTQSMLETLVVPVGVGQTWQDVTASRAYGTTYTNSTGRPITVVISFSFNGSAAVLGQLTVSGVAIQFGQINSAYINLDSGTAIVPNGATYVFTATSGSLSISKWVELR